MGPLVIALGAASCFSDRGVAIEVDVGDTGATTVELYLGTASCDTTDSQLACTGIAPPPRNSPLLRGSVWFRDALLPYTAAVKGHTATFQLRTDTPSTVPVVLAVGLAEDGTGVGIATLNALDVSVHGARVVTTTLAAAQKVIPGETTTMTEDRVLVWKKATPASSCVMVEHWRSGKADRTFVVPAEDPDCDDVSAPECNPAAWHGELTAGASPTPDCFSISTSGTPACVLGSRGCSDDEPQNKTACAPQRDRVCVPDAFCAGASCGRFDEACLKSLVVNDALTRISCDVPTLLGPALDLCQNGNSATIDLASHYPSGPCEEQSTIASLALAGFNTSASFGGAVIELKAPRPACQFDVQWKSGTRTMLAMTDYGLIKLPTNQGALLIPISFTFHPGTCGTLQFHCEIKGSTTDSLWGCGP